MQDQGPRVLTWSIAPGFQQTFSGKTLLTVNPFVRRDQLNFYGSRDPFSDAPVFATQNRFLTNYGVKADIAHFQGPHELKAGPQIQQTRLLQTFPFGLPNPPYHPSSPLPVS